VQAVFILGDRVGKQQKTIDVFTDGPSENAMTTTLVLQVNIADVVASHPRMLVWKLADPAVEKMIEFQPVGARVIRSLTPPAKTPGFSCRLQSDEAKRTFRLYITPTSTAAPASAVIQLTATVDERPPIALSVYAVVR
jgi:hypothetical protein